MRGFILFANFSWCEIYNLFLLLNCQINFEKHIQRNNESLGYWPSPWHSEEGGYFGTARFGTARLGYMSDIASQPFCICNPCLPFHEQTSFSELHKLNLPVPFWQCSFFFSTTFINVCTFQVKNVYGAGDYHLKRWRLQEGKNLKLDKTKIPQ